VAGPKPTQAISTSTEARSTAPEQDAGSAAGWISSTMARS
jgi:hypothetical protein